MGTALVNNRYHTDNFDEVSGGYFEYYKVPKKIEKYVLIFFTGCGYKPYRTIKGGRAFILPCFQKVQK
jgi:hypothetical protein